ncbi:hypothetical protein E2C01_054373 [Portunus trituberculatus]|uniref:Uncharacterized protein n=1 Tax=Portunus trituberculatus TaxID=210409 RepID=A0A5B7GNB2_PORTR|nr:hypothetical protein [Portunus trituberculatus]
MPSPKPGPEGGKARRGMSRARYTITTATTITVTTTTNATPKIDEMRKVYREGAVDNGAVLRCLTSWQDSYLEYLVPDNGWLNSNEQESEIETE